MNEHKPTAVYLPALKGETSRVDPNEANELEGAVENIRILLQGGPNTEQKGIVYVCQNRFNTNS